jgi:hypothetical protein
MLIPVCISVFVISVAVESQDALRHKYVIFNGIRIARFGAVLLMENTTVRAVCEDEVQKIFPGWKEEELCLYQGYLDKYVTYL